jgi:hypothetical protein
VAPAVRAKSSVEAQVQNVVFKESELVLVFQKNEETKL